MLVMLLGTTLLETMPTKSLSMITTLMLVMRMVTMPTMLLLPMPAMGPMLALVLTTPMDLAVVCCVRWWLLIFACFAVVL